MVQSGSPTHLLIEVFFKSNNMYRLSCMRAPGLDHSVPPCGKASNPPCASTWWTPARLMRPCISDEDDGYNVGREELLRLCEGNDDVDDKVDLSRERFSQIFVKGPVQLFMFQLVPDINNLDLWNVMISNCNSRKCHSIRIMLHAKANLAYSAIPFSWSGYKLESIRYRIFISDQKRRFFCSWKTSSHW